MKIEAGKYYRTRDGKKVGPINRRDDRPKWGGFIKGDADGAVDGYRYWADDGAHYYNISEYDIISEWHDEPTSPVRTVTRKEIVPGTYGRVSVLGPAPGGGAIELALVEPHGTLAPKSGATSLNPAELRAAIAIFTQLADALDDGDAK